MKNIKSRFDFLFDKFNTIDDSFIYNNWSLYITISTPINNIELYINNLL